MDGIIFIPLVPLLENIAFSQEIDISDGILFMSGWKIFFF